MLNLLIQLSDVRGRMARAIGVISSGDTSFFQSRLQRIEGLGRFHVSSSLGNNLF